MTKYNNKTVKLCLLENIFKDNLHSYDVVNRLINPFNLNQNYNNSIFKRLTERRRLKKTKFSHTLFLEKLLQAEN